MNGDALELHRRWRAIVRCFPLWRFAFDLMFDPGSWRMIGADITSLVVEGKNARRAAQAMEGVSAQMLDTLTAMAKVNEQRSNDVFRAVFLGYVSAPLALGALLSDAAPDVLSEILRANAASIVVFLLGALVLPIVYFCGNWRAKQIAWVIELYRAGAIEPLTQPAKSAKPAKPA
jgi:hypothetical protein